MSLETMKKAMDRFTSLRPGRVPGKPIQCSKGHGAQLFPVFDEAVDMD